MEVNELPDIPMFAKTIFSDALNKRASDVHIDPGSTRFRIRFRVDGSLQDYVSIPMSYFEQLRTHFKILAELDTTSVFTPQDGHFVFNFAHLDEKTGATVSVVVDLRISIFPTIHGDASVFRIANSVSHVLNLDGL